MAFANIIPPTYTIPQIMFPGKESIVFAQSTSSTNNSLHKHVHAVYVKNEMNPPNYHLHGNKYLPYIISLPKDFSIYSIIQLLPIKSPKPFEPTFPFVWHKTNKRKPHSTLYHHRPPNLFLHVHVYVFSS